MAENKGCGAPPGPPKKDVLDGLRSLDRGERRWYRMIAVPITPCSHR
jgi:hypothetical protein